MAETSNNESYSSVTETDEECEIRILKWQFELILNTIEGGNLSSRIDR